MPSRGGSALYVRLFVLCAALAASGCSDPCEDAAQEICAKACECGGSSCPTSFTGDSGGKITLGFESEEDCAALFERGCAEDTEDAFDAEACLEAAPGASCGDSAEGVLVPAECS
jgi:hypothetical protein